MRILRLIIVGYLMYGVMMIWMHPRVIYPFGTDEFDAPGFRKQTVGDRAVPLAIHDGSDVAVLFFMGNGGSLAYFTYTLNAHTNAGRTLVGMEYRGGGGISGRPFEKLLKADALAAYDWLAANHNGPIIAHGTSLGTGLALHVAAHRDVGAIILDAPYVKLCTLMAQASYLPACALPFVQKWNNAALIPQLSAPILIQHGSDDKLIPISQSEQLTTLMQKAGLDVTFYPIDGASHNNLAGQPGYENRINSFVQR